MQSPATRSRNEHHRHEERGGRGEPKVCEKRFPEATTGAKKVRRQMRPQKANAHLEEQQRCERQNEEGQVQPAVQTNPTTEKGPERNRQDYGYSKDGDLEAHDDL
jgi:hypothetical protein